MKILFNIFKWTVGLMLVFLMVGVIFEQVSRVNLNAKRPDDSQFVDLMGRQIHFVKKGRGGEREGRGGKKGGEEKEKCVCWERGDV